MNHYVYQHNFIQGIAFSLIIVRVGLGLTSNDLTYQTRRSSVATAAFGGHHLQNLNSAAQVQVSQERKVHEEFENSLILPCGNASSTDVDDTIDAKLSSSRITTDTMV